MAPSRTATPITSQRLLASLTLPAFDAPVISGQQYSAQAGHINPFKAVATGVATWFRVTAGNEVATPVFDGSAGVLDCDLILTPTAFLEAGVNVTISSLTVTGQASQDVIGVATVIVPSSGPVRVKVPSGYTGAEPAFSPSIAWSGYRWETANWGAGSGWPSASQVSIDSNGYLVLKVSTVSGNLLGAEVDSVRGDLAIPGNPSRWGYGTYRWVIGTDLATIDPTVVLGLFTFWAYGTPTSVPANPNGKGGTHGQKEIDIEVSNWLPEGQHSLGTFHMLGFYQDDNSGVSAGVPATYGQSCHTMTAGSQSLVQAGHPVSTLEFIWMPDHITWNLWYGTDTSVPPDHTLTMTEGETYDYTAPYGGNHFAGTVHIPATGGQQVIMNLWAQGQAGPIPDTTVILRSFSQIPSDA